MESSQIQLYDPKLRNLNKKLLYIFILNIIDGILTYIGVSNNYTVEVNRLMVNIVSDFNKLVIIKLLLPSLIILFIAFIINKFQNLKMPVAYAFITICYWVYISVLFTHFIWIGLVIYHTFV